MWSEVRAFIGLEGALLPAIDGALDSDGVLGFLSEGTDEIQNLDLGSATGGTYTLGFIDHAGVKHVTANIAFDATSSAIQLALGLLPPIGTDGITVVDGTDNVLTFEGASVSAQPHNLLVLDATNLTGSTGEEVILTTAGIAIWEEAGLINEGVTIEYTPTYEDKFVDRSNGPLLSILVSENLMVEYNLGEKDLNTMDNAISATTKTVQNQASGVVGQVTMGLGDGVDPIIALALQGETAEGFPRLWYFSACKITGTNNDKQDKKANDHTVTYTILSDLNKPLGSRMAEIFDMTAPADA